MSYSPKKQERGEDSSSSEAAGKSAGAATSQLASLFAPPPSSATATTTGIGGAENEQPPHAVAPVQTQPPQSLSSLFAPPPPQANISPLLSSPSAAAAAAGPPILSSLFTPPPPIPPASALTDRVPTTRTSNERTALLAQRDAATPQTKPDRSFASGMSSGDGGGDEGAFAALKQTKKVQLQRQQTEEEGNDKDSCWNSFYARHPILQSILKPTTIVGSLMFLLYHVVFVLAFGSAIMRPHKGNSSGSILGFMAKLASVGIVGAGPLYIYRLNQDIPAVYPSVDLFLAPFFAQAAIIVDESLWEQYSAHGNGNYPDALFLGSFAVLASIGMAFAGLFLWLGSTFKLANLGTYLPYSVLSGFFSAVGVLLWCLAFSVDANGRTWKQVFLGEQPQGGGSTTTTDTDDEDSYWQTLASACAHHGPSLFMGIIMNRLGPKNPFYVIVLIVVMIAGFYLTLCVTGSTLEDAQQAGWSWSVDELVYHDYDNDNDNDNATTNSNTSMIPNWALPPSPFGSIAALLAGHVNFKAVSAGLSNMVALAFLYLLRSSIHASAMKKNVSNLVMRIPVPKNKPVPSSALTTTNGNMTITPSSTNDDPDHEHDHDQKNEAFTETIGTAHISNPKDRRGQGVLERVTESVRIVNMSMQNKKALHPRQKQGKGIEVSKEDGDQDHPGFIEIRAKTPRRSLESIFSEYSYALFVVAGIGGFGVCPTVATSNTMFAIGADRAAPQYGSIMLLVVFYLLDFRMVQYIPKMAFSSLLVLGAVDTLVVWFFGAFRKTQDLAEWLVVPLIAGCSLFVGFLNAVFLGIAISMFVFVASFFRVGVVKYSASGLEIRSRIERSMAESAWLSDNGDLYQVLVLQNYLFFGNAISVLNYIATMFEEVDETQSERLDFSLPPIPKILVFDLSLVSGMDTSTIDVFAEIFEFCKNNDCKLFICGISMRMRKGLELGGVNPDRGGPRSQSSLRFFSDLDTALGRAEDNLIQTEMIVPRTPRPAMRSIKSMESLDRGAGFRLALKQIDELHGLEFTLSLLDFEPYIQTIDLEPGQCLYKCDDGMVEESDRGLFFIEEGLLKIQRDSMHSVTRTRSSIGAGSSIASHQYTLKNQHARMGSVARRGALARGGKHPSTSSNLRLARLGPGWVCGTLDFGGGIRSSGITVAVTKSRLHLLPFHVLAEIEKDDPALVLSLYKLVTHLRAHREEATIEQLTTLNNILTSPAHSKPISRAALRAMGP